MTVKDDSLRVLVVADVWGQMDDLCDQIKAELDRPDAEVLVVAPVLVGRLHSFCGDVDAEHAATKRALIDMLRCLKRHGVYARGKVGNEDPATAVWDAISGIAPDMDFPPDKIIAVTHDRAHETWREHNLVPQLEGYGVPVRHLVIEQSALEQVLRPDPSQRRGSALAA
jgi:hypothetical protein